MESNAETHDKRKADAISPTREGSRQSTSIANDRKRRDNLCSEDEQDNSMLEEERDEEEDEDENGPGDMSNDNKMEIMEEEMDEFERFTDEEEFMGPEETEVEEKEHSQGDQKLTFKMFLAQEEEHRFANWMETIHVHCSYEGKVVGRGFGRYVERDWIRDTFWVDMEEPCHELSQIAFELFDRYGRLRTELKDHPIRKGKGVWGSELNLGTFFVIEDVFIDKQWRRKAIGTKIVTYLIEKSRASSRSPQFSVVAPGWHNSDIESALQGKTKDEQRKIRDRAFDNAVSFYRTLGFRRIGASSYFGLAAAAGHPARAILPTDDFDPAEGESDVDEGPEHQSSDDWGVKENRKSWRLDLLKNRLPLHHAAITLPDSECKEFFRAWKSNENPADEWTKVDRYSNNVLHIAACELKVQTIRWLIDDSGEGQILSLARNVKGYTPIEELESDLETKRTRRNHGMMTIDISENFSGFAPQAISCLAALRNLGNLSQTQYAQLKFGCTCGSCIGGFLSPRMSFALLCQAEMTHDMLNEYVEDGKKWCMTHNLNFKHVSPDIQRNFATNKSYRQGFANIFGHAATILRKNISPTILHVSKVCADSSEWPPHTKNFLERGGEPESVLRIIFEDARYADEWAGNGSHMETFGEQVKALSECRNDREFGFVALACGMPYLSRLYGQGKQMDEPLMLTEAGGMIRGRN